MAHTLDARIPVILGRPDQAGPDDAVLAEGAGGFVPAQATGHAAGCACCAARNSAGRALAGMLQARARGEVPFFRRVVAWAETQAGRVELAAALTDDPVASACYRLTSAIG